MNGTIVGELIDGIKSRRLFKFCFGLRMKKEQFNNAYHDNGLKMYGFERRIDKFPKMLIKW